MLTNLAGALVNTHTGSRAIRARLVGSADRVLGAEAIPTLAIGLCACACPIPHYEMAYHIAVCVMLAVTGVVAHSLSLLC